MSVPANVTTNDGYEISVKIRIYHTENLCYRPNSRVGGRMEINMKYLFYALIGVLILVIWSIINERKALRRLKQDLQDSWGKEPEDKYTSEKFNSLKEYYLTIRDDKLDIDDISWSDLDMDEIYMLINNTSSAIGEEYLYAMLRKPCFSNDELKERNRLISFFNDNAEARINLQVKLRHIGKLRQVSVYEYMSRLNEQEAKSNLPHYLMILGLLASVALIMIYPGLGGILTVTMLANNIYQYYKAKAQIEKYFAVFSYLLRLLDNIEDIYQLNIQEIKTYTVRLKEDASVFRKLKKGANIVVSKNASGGLQDAILDYLRMLFHIDLIKYNSMLNIFKKNKNSLNSMYNNIGLLDSLIAVASFRNLIPYYSEPVLYKANRQPGIKVIDLYHPLINEPVPNSITENSSVLLTGSNASGKSTFIKTLAINAILSQTIYTSISKEYNASFFIIYTSMALRDNLFNNESYYIVEIKSLKRILERTNKDIPILCFIDEVLRGTNTIERIAASSRILSSLSKMNTLCFAATHDIELTRILENYFMNYHFQERIIDNQIIFDYKLYKGRAVSKNAIKLLALLGYSNDIITEAENAIEDFSTNGEWSKIRSI